jgi:hypothetical protein
MHVHKGVKAPDVVYAELNFHGHITRETVAWIAPGTGAVLLLRAWPATVEE